MFITCVTVDEEREQSRVTVDEHTEQACVTICEEGKEISITVDQKKKKKRTNRYNSRLESNTQL